MELSQVERKEICNAFADFLKAISKLGREQQSEMLLCASMYRHEVIEDEFDLDAIADEFLNCVDKSFIIVH